MPNLWVNLARAFGDRLREQGVRGAIVRTGDTIKLFDRRDALPSAAPANLNKAPTVSWVSEPWRPQDAFPKLPDSAPLFFGVDAGEQPGFTVRTEPTAASLGGFPLDCYDSGGCNRDPHCFMLGAPEG